MTVFYEGALMRFRSVTSVLVALTVLITAGAASMAIAHETAAASATTFRYSEASGKFQGRVSSPQARCERNRVVKVSQETPQGLEFVGKTRTDSEGRWRVSEPNANGAYRAVVVRRVGRNDRPRHIHICQRAESSTVSVNP